MIAIECLIQGGFFANNRFVFNKLSDPSPKVSWFCFHRGLFITIHDRGHIANVLQSWPEKDIRVSKPHRMHVTAAVGLGFNSFTFQPMTKDIATATTCHVFT